MKFRHPDSSIGKYDQLIDTKEFEREELQRPFQYLKQYASNQQVKKIRQITAQGTPQECIQFLLRYFLHKTYLNIFELKYNDELK